MKQKALFIGNSDGIGLAATNRLLKNGWEIYGISKSNSSIKDENYHHNIADVSEGNYQNLLSKLVQENPPQLCIYFAGIGEFLNLSDMSKEVKVIDVNFTGMVRTAAIVIPEMVKQQHGHFIGLSSMADELISLEAPSYNASKAGFSNYLAGLAKAVKKKGVNVTNVRFGFVDTKMAKADKKPFMISIEKAVDHLEYCIKKKPVRYSTPKIMIPIVKLIKLITSLGLL
ncbi:MAG: SDR family NAD(P)-dependent oxidoreductase [Sedimentisphaerales bacterium]|nr:SDR family NAD(P)-dependent oxidoreductase [Sedimentisphaerales bacterium]